MTDTPPTADEAAEVPAGNSQAEAASTPDNVTRFTTLVTERRHRIALGERWNAWRQDQNPTITLRGVAIHRPNLRDLDLSGIDFGGASLCEALCNRTNFSQAKLTGVALRGADLCDADFTGADLRGADLRWCRRGTQAMFAAATGDAATQLPEGITRPSSWES